MGIKKTSKIMSLLIAICLFVIGFYCFAIGVHAAAPDEIDDTDVVSDTIKRPSLELVLEDAVVDMITVSDGKISAEYNKDVYDIQINQSEEFWKVTCKRKTDTNNETVKLYIPAINYEKINMSLNSVNLTCAVIKFGDIVGNFELSSVFLTLPKGFKGSLDLVTNGYLNLTSQDDFENTNSTIIAEDGMWRTVYAPKYFKRSGNMFTYTNGTMDNVIKITKKEDGVVGVYSSKNFGSADFSFNQQIDGENIDELKWENGSWEANWINNWLSNWNSEMGNEYID